MKFPPKECPRCGSPYWSKHTDTSGEAATVWQGEDREWYHGHLRTTALVQCANCEFGFSLTQEKGKLPVHTFLVKLVETYQNYLTPMLRTFLTHLPETLIFREATPNRGARYIDITFRILLRDQGLTSRRDETLAEKGEEEEEEEEEAASPPSP